MKLVALLVSASCWGCDVGELSSTPGGSTDDAALDATALQAATTWNQLPEINVQPYVSAVGAFDINVYVAVPAGD